MGLRDRWHEHQVLKDGVAAEARVLDKSPVKTRLDGSAMGEGDLTTTTERLIVEVQPEDGPPFRAEVLLTARSTAVGTDVVAPMSGGTVPVRYDPKDHTVVLDTEALKRRAGELAQQVKEAQDARADAILAGADPQAARMGEADAMLKGVQAAGFMSPQMQALMQQAEAFMQPGQPPGTPGAARPGLRISTPGTATVIDYQTLANTGSVIAVRVRVSCQPPGGEPIETTLDTAVSPQRLGELVAGAKLPILFDGNDPSKVYPASSLQ